MSTALHNVTDVPGIEPLCTQLLPVHHHILRMYTPFESPVTALHIDSCALRTHGAKLLSHVAVCVVARQVLVMANEFPYYCQEGVHHINIWSSGEPLTDRQVRGMCMY